MAKPHDFILIDDDNLNNIICQKIILKMYPNANIKTFTDPNIGLRHIHTIYGGKDANDAFLFLDINMPTLMGWDVLDEIISFPETLRNRMKIFMLTSSVDPRDKKRADNNHHLWGFIEKPLTDVKVKAIVFDEV